MALVQLGGRALNLDGITAIDFPGASSASVYLLGSGVLTFQGEDVEALRCYVSRLPPFPDGPEVEYAEGSPVLSPQTNHGEKRG